jgi:hypothetical protein
MISAEMNTDKPAVMQYQSIEDVLAASRKAAAEFAGKSQEEVEAANYPPFENPLYTYQNVINEGGFLDSHLG